MSTKFLITPKRKNSLIKQEFYKKGKQSFYIESKWNECSILLDKKPKSKIVDGKKVTIFKNMSFKDGEYNYKKRLVIPDDVSAEDKKILRKKFKDFSFYSIDDYGWKQSKEIFTLLSEFDIKEVPVHQLTLFSSENEYLVMKITKEKFNEYKDNGMPYEDYLEFDGETEVSAPNFDERVSLSIDDIDIPNIQELLQLKYNEAIKQYQNSNPVVKKSKKKIKSADLVYAVIEERWIKRSWRSLTIYEEFDIDKLVINISRDDVFGRDYYVETFTLLYGEEEFEFLENYGVDSSSACLITSNGDEYGFDILDEDFDEDEDEEDFDE